MSGDESTPSDYPIPIGRFGRLIVLIAVVSGVFLFTAARALPSQLFSIAAVFIGVVALVTTISGFLISMAGYVGAEPEPSEAPESP